VGDGFKWPSLKPAQLKKLLASLGYQPDSNANPGSHEWLRAQGRNPIRWAFHDSKRELAPNEVKKVLVKQAGLSLEEAKQLVSGK
jgi:predicted RNA binding protein YcfA (HicA-like mRNA interferase family)